MEIITDYDGAAIQILEDNKEDNTLTLSPREENNSYSNYFNFKIKNNTNKKGIIYIKNSNNALFKGNNKPYIRLDEKDAFKHIDDKHIEVLDDTIKITIDKNSDCEISSYPRYVENDLNDFINNINKEFVSIEDGIVKKITIGELDKKAIVIIGRQHPGETLSSYFIEGIINEIINNHKDYEDLCFILYPIINTNGVKNGNHRYTDGIDYNRSWNTTGIVNELDFIKEELNKYNIDCFIDVHCDEVSNIDYIRTKTPIEEFDDVKVIAEQNKLRRFLRALVKQRKVISFKTTTAREYVSKTYKCDNMLIELSLNINDEATSRNKGEDFVKNLRKRK